MRIPLPKLMRHWREREFERHLTPATVRSGLQALGLLRQAPCPLPAGDPRRHGRSRLCRTPARALLMAAAGEGLDQVPRLPRSAGRDLPGALEARAQGSLRMSARDDIFANIRRSLGVNGSETIRQQMVADRLERAPEGRDPGSAVRSRARSGSRSSRPWPRPRFATVTEVASAAEVPQSDRGLPAQPQPAGHVAHGRRSAPRGHALGGDHPRDRPRAERRRRPQRREPCLRRRRRDRHAGHGLGPREPLDPQLPARQPHRRGLGQGHRRRLRGRLEPASASPTARAPCRAR